MLLLGLEECCNCNFLKLQNCLRFVNFLLNEVLKVTISCSKLLVNIVKTRRSFRIAINLLPTKLYLNFRS